MKSFRSLRDGWPSIALVEMDGENPGLQKDVVVPLLRGKQLFRESESIYDRPLPCCGCGVGWCSFMTGFVFPFTWYYGTYLFLTSRYRRDPRERPGLAACAIAASVSVVAGFITMIILVARLK